MHISRKNEITSVLNKHRTHKCVLTRRLLLLDSDVTDSWTVCSGVRVDMLNKLFFDVQVRLQLMLFYAPIMHVIRNFFNFSVFLHTVWLLILLRRSLEYVLYFVFHKYCTKLTVENCPWVHQKVKFTKQLWCYLHLKHITGKKTCYSQPGPWNFRV